MTPGAKDSRSFDLTPIREPSRVLHKCISQLASIPESDARTLEKVGCSCIEKVKAG